MVCTGPAPVTEASNGRTIRARHGSSAADLGLSGPVCGTDRIGDRLQYIADRVENPAAVSRGPRARQAGPADAGRDPQPLRGDTGQLVGRRAAPAVGPAVAGSERNRRTRIRSQTARSWQALTGWLHRIARCHAHLCAIVRLYGDPDRAARNANNTIYHARAAAGDPSILHDAICVTIDEMVEVRDQIQQHMDAAAAPTSAAPGTPDKVEELRRRAERGESLFVAGDADGVGPADGFAG
jgi:hypothetical protein